MKRYTVIVMLLGVILLGGMETFSQDTGTLTLEENTAISKKTVSSAIAKDEQEENKIAKDYALTLPLPVLDANLTVSEETVS